MKRIGALLVLLAVFFLAHPFSAAGAEYRPEKEQIEEVRALLPKIGKRFSSAHGSLTAIQVGKPYEAGRVVSFAEYGQFLVWGLEEWEKPSEGKFRMVYWKFWFSPEKGKYYSVTTGESLFSEERLGVDRTYEVPINITSDTPEAKEANEKSKLIWEILMRQDLPL